MPLLRNAALSVHMVKLTQEREITPYPLIEKAGRAAHAP
jgi:hypothetical protein